MTVTQRLITGDLEFSMAKTSTPSMIDESGETAPKAKQKPRESGPKFLRRYVISGKMPLERAPGSGLFVTQFKEDAFFLDFDERALLFKGGARTEQDLSLPLFVVENSFYKRKRLIETLGLRGAEGKLAVFLQYARLPLIDPRDMEELRDAIMSRAENARKTLLDAPDPPALFDAARLDLCDEPITQVSYDKAARRVSLRVRVPEFKPKPMPIPTKKGYRAQFLEYDDLLCSKVGLYLLTFFQVMPMVQEVDVQMWRMTDKMQDKVGWHLEDEFEVTPGSNVRRFSAQFKVTPQIPLTKAEQKLEAKMKQKAAQEAIKNQPKKNRKQIQQEKLAASTQRAPQPGDELFDDSLPNQTLLLATRVTRPGFMELERSRANYTARKALSFFDLHYAPDDEALALFPVEPIN